MQPLTVNSHGKSSWCIPWSCLAGYVQYLVARRERCRADSSSVRASRSAMRRLWPSRMCCISVPVPVPVPVAPGMPVQAVRLASSSGAADCWVAERDAPPEHAHGVQGPGLACWSGAVGA